MSVITPTLAPRDRKLTIASVTGLPTDTTDMNSNIKSDKRRSIIELNLIDQNHVSKLLFLFRYYFSTLLPKNNNIYNINFTTENALRAKWQQPHPNSFFADFVRLSRNVEIKDEEGTPNSVIIINITILYWLSSTDINF